MTIRPIADRVIIRRLKAEEKTPGGIIVPDVAKEMPAEGEVIAVGPGAFSEHTGRRIEPEVKRETSDPPAFLPARRRRAGERTSIATSEPYARLS